MRAVDIILKKRGGGTLSEGEIGYFVAGRDRVEDRVDPAVGVIVLARPGDAVREGDGVLELHYRDRTRLERALALAPGAIMVTDAPPPCRPLIAGEVH